MTETILGIDLETGEQVTVATELRQRSMYVVGIQGGGKSSLLQTLIHQDIAAGSCVIVIDPHEDLLYDVIAQLPQEALQRTYLLDLTDRSFPFGLNIFACPNPHDDEQRDITRNRVTHMFERIWPETAGGRYFGTLLENVIDTLIETPGTTMADIPALLCDEQYRASLITQLRNHEVKDFWLSDYNKKSVAVQQKERDPLMSRVRELLRQTTIKNILCQKRSTFDVRTAIENREIILINLPLRHPAYEKSAPIMGIMLLSEICRAVFSFGTIRDMSKRPRFSLYVDEFQNFTTSDFSRLFTEGRKFGVRTTVAHQERSQLDETNTHASHTAFTKVVFQPTAQDAAELADYFRVKDSKVKPENIYKDVLNHLAEHPEPLVQAFYDSYIQPLQQAARAKVKHYRDEDVYPHLSMGDRTFAVHPEHVGTLLERIQTCLYEAALGNEVVLPNYAQIAAWWDFPHAYNKEYYQQPTKFAFPHGWKLACTDGAFPETTSYLVSLLQEYGGIHHWHQHPEESHTYSAFADATLGKEWLEKTKLITLLDRMLEEETAFLSVVFNRYHQGTPETLIQAAKAKPLTYEYLQSFLQVKGSLPTREQITTLLEHRRSRFRPHYIGPTSWGFQIYLGYLREQYRKQLAAAMPQLPIMIPQQRTVRWWTLAPIPLRSEGLLAQRQYDQAMQQTHTITASELDQPARITAPFAVWKKALDDEAQFVALLVYYTEPTYFLHGKTDVDTIEKLLREHCRRWLVYTHDLLAYVKEDLELTRKHLLAERASLEEQLVIKKFRIIKRINHRLTEEERRHQHFVTLFLATIEELKTNPLGELKTPTSTQMKEALLSLKPRQAYVRIGTDVYRLQTLAIPGKVSSQEAAKRVAAIRAQTHTTYCQHRAVVEAGFAAAPEPSLQRHQPETPKAAGTTRQVQPYEDLDEE